MMPPLKALFFDMFGTMLDWRTSVARETSAILEPRGHSRDWHAFADAWRAAARPGISPPALSEQIQCRRIDNCSFWKVQLRGHDAGLFEVRILRGKAMMASSSYRKIWFQILHRPQPSNRAARIFNFFLAAVILANCLAVALETVSSIFAPRKDLFFYLEAISIGVFVVEYCLRVWACVELQRYASPVLGRILFAIQPLPLLELLVIGTYFTPVDLRFLRIFRLTRLLRVLRLEEFDRSMHSVWVGIKRRKSLLVVSLTFMLIAVYSAAALLYLAERNAQPEAFSSIPETLWWAVMTLTTVGYGDVTPITNLGKFLAGAIAITGIGIFALPAAIMTAAILEAGVDREAVCPHCGKAIDERGRA